MVGLIWFAVGLVCGFVIGTLATRSRTHEHLMDVVERRTNGLFRNLRKGGSVCLSIHFVDKQNKSQPTELSEHDGMDDSADFWKRN